MEESPAPKAAVTTVRQWVSETVIREKGHVNESMSAGNVFGSVSHHAPWLFGHTGFQCLLRQRTSQYNSGLDLYPNQTSNGFLFHRQHRLKGWEGEAAVDEAPASGTCWANAAKVDGAGWTCAAAGATGDTRAEIPTDVGSGTKDEVDAIEAEGKAQGVAGGDLKGVAVPFWGAEANDTLLCFSAWYLATKASRTWSKSWRESMSCICRGSCWNHCVRTREQSPLIRLSTNSLCWLQLLRLPNMCKISPRKMS